MCTLGEKKPLAENTDLCIRVHCYVAAPALAFRPRTPLQGNSLLALAMKPDTSFFRREDVISHLFEMKDKIPRTKRQ